MINRKITFIFLLLSVLFLHSSYSQNYDAVDKLVQKYPKSFGTTDDLAERIKKDFKDDNDKARAIFTWIAINLKYDYASFLNPPKSQGFSYSTEAEKQKKLQQLDDKIIQKAFKSQKAVCEGFSLLYQNLATKVGLKCDVIKGDSKTRLSDIGREKLGSDHAWNIVYFDGKWRLIDVTWGQGYYDGSKGRMVIDFAPMYFDADPDYFFAKHYPDSGTYLNSKISKDDFLNGPLIYNKTIEGDNKIKAPKSGIIEAKNGDKVTFEFKNISKTDQFYYLNKKNQPVRVQNGKERKGGLEFQIVIDNTIGNYITFFLDTSSIASFKVVMK